MPKPTSILTSFFERILIEFASESEGPTPQNDKNSLRFLIQDANRAFRTLAPFRHRFGANWPPFWCQNPSKSTKKAIQNEVRILTEFLMDFGTILDSKMVQNGRFFRPEDPLFGSMIALRASSAAFGLHFALGVAIPG